jgi:thiol:disulfide interchange protein
MRIALSSFVLTLLLAASSMAQAVEWGVGLKAAQAAATQGNRPIMVNFTGSDWCGWCVRLKAEVFDTPEFAAWAAAKVVLLEADFPNENPPAPAQAEENQALAAQFRIEGFPTIVIFKADGTELGRLGYMQGGPAAWIAAADGILATAKP